MRDDQEQEIDLFEFVTIAFKRRKIVLAAVFLSVLVATVRVLLLPRVYEVSMIIGPPVTAITDRGVQYFDSAASVKALIDLGANNNKIADELQFKEGSFSFDVFLPKDTRLIKVSLRVPEDGIEAGKAILGKLFEKLTLVYSRDVDGRRNQFDNRLKTILGEIARQEEAIRLKSAQFGRLEERERQLVEEIKETKSKSDALFAKGDSFLGQGDKKDVAAAQLYIASAQQNMSYSSQLRNDLTEAKNNTELSASAILGLKNEIAQNRIEIGSQNLLKNDVQNLAVIREPYASSGPVGTGGRVVILAAAAFGLVLGLLAAIVAEYWTRRS